METLLKQKFITWGLNKPIKGLFFLCLIAGQLGAQVAPAKYYIQFTDKNNSPYSVANPLVYLSQRALDRRTHHNIAVTAHDFPVNPQYVQGVEQVANCTVLLRLRWLNGIVIETTDTLGLQQVYNLPFVDSLNSQRGTQTGISASDKWLIEEKEAPIASFKEGQQSALIDYGAATNQNTMLQVDKIHDMGYTGQSMRIAVLDAGFRGVDTVPVLDHLWANGKIVAEWDFVNNATNNYAFHSNHGTRVLMCMGANAPGYYVGSAPDAEFILIRTEDAPTEYIIEEYNWVAGAEFADSAGADVFNTSLGYTTFDDPSQDHSYDDLDGNTTVITRAADMAASKGILVVNSAGNSGGSPWRYIGAPADGDSVLAIGATDANGVVTSFSSRGPSADGRVKPNVMAMGGGVPMPRGDGTLTFINGTSFSGPILAGAAACLWQSRANYTNMEVFEAIQESAHLYTNPNDDYGYGIPNMEMAYHRITGVANVTSEAEGLRIYPNPAMNMVTIAMKGMVPSNAPLEIFNGLGQRVLQKQGVTFPYTVDISHLPSGLYLVKWGTMETATSLIIQ